MDLQLRVMTMLLSRQSWTCEGPGPLWGRMQASRTAPRSTSVLSCLRREEGQTYTNMAKKYSWPPSEELASFGRDNQPLIHSHSFSDWQMVNFRPWARQEPLGKPFRIAGTEGCWNPIAEDQQADERIRSAGTSMLARAGALSDGRGA